MAKNKANAPSQGDRKNAKDIEKLNAQFNEIMSSELRSLQGETSERQEALSRLHNKFLSLVQQDVQNVNHNKSANQSTYDYIASALTGRTASNQDDQAEQRKIRKSLDRLFAGGDSELASYFMSNGISNMHIYDEIDSVCAYMYQLEEAIDVIRDNVLTSEQPSEGISMDIKFEGKSEEESAEYRKVIMDMFRDEGLTTMLKSHTVKKAVKYGSTYIMFIPYSDIVDKMENLRGGYGTTENMALFESANSDSHSDSSYTLESAMEDIASILDINKGDKKKSKSSEESNGKSEYLYETICNNLKTITVCETVDPPNVAGMSYSKISGLDQSVTDAIISAMKESKKDLNKSTKSKPGTKGYSDGLVDATSKEIEGIKGCYIKQCDPRQMRPIKIFDYTIGYYYFENYEYDYSGTTLTDIMSNVMNFDQKTQIVDRLVDSVLGKLKYGDILSGDKQFRNMILNCLMYAEKRDNPLRIKFVPNQYVVEYKTNMDENKNGQPVLLRSLFFARLYISLLLFYITAIITKSTDSEFYYLRESALDPRYENQVTDVMDQLQQCNVDPISIASGQILNSTKAINKRYFLSTGTNDQKAFDVDVMSGQSIDINNEFLTDIKKMAISSTGVPSVMIDMVDEIDYATMLSMANIKNLKRCNSIQEDFNPAITQTAKIVAKYTTNIPEDFIDSMSCTLRPSKTIQNNISGNQINDVVGMADNMVKLWYHGDDSGEATELDKRVMDKARKAIAYELAPSIPWSICERVVNEAIIEVKKDMEREKIIKQSESEEGGDDSM